MTSQELLDKLILDLNVLLAQNDVAVNENIGDGDFLLGSNRLKTLITSNEVIHFITYLNKVHENIDLAGELNDDILVTGNPHVLDFSNPDLSKKNRAFAYSDPDFGFFSSKYLFDSGSLRDFSLLDVNSSLLWKQISEFCERCYTTAQDSLVNDFFNCIITRNLSLGFLIKKGGNVLNEERHYAYVYLSYLNNSKFLEIPSELKYSNTLLNNSLALDDTKTYEQYFDIYDVFNEVNMSEDLLSRFLKLYHSLEYLIYRVYLVELANKVGGNKIFVREFVNASESMKKNEKGIFTQNFGKIFLSDLAYIKTNLVPTLSINVTTFLSKVDIVNDFGPNAAKVDIIRIAHLIYGIRCCIVHNKESEYHLTLSNYDDYLVIIPLIKEVIKTFESLVIAKVKDDFAVVKYPDREMKLY